MFDRGHSRTEGPLRVEITLQDGRELNGTLVVPIGRSLSEVLNGASAFLEFEPTAGERVFIARSCVQSVKPIDLPPAPSLTVGSTDAAFNPCAILGVDAGASREQVRDAYLSLAKAYHPDRYATAELPPEVQKYLAAKARRINAAHDALEAAHQQQGPSRSRCSRASLGRSRAEASTGEEERAPARDGRGHAEARGTSQLGVMVTLADQDRRMAVSTPSSTSLRTRSKSPTNSPPRYSTFPGRGSRPAPSGSSASRGCGACR
jgi:hypothetical protein